MCVCIYIYIYKLMGACSSRETNLRELPNLSAS